jgi:hypothetical protein
MAGILKLADFLKSCPFSKFHPFYLGISNISTGFAKKQPFEEFQPYGLDSEKGRDYKKQPFTKFQPFATKLSQIHHFPHLQKDKILFLPPISLTFNIYLLGQNWGSNFVFAQNVRPKIYLSHGRM